MFNKYKTIQAQKQRNSSIFNLLSMATIMVFLVGILWVIPKLISKVVRSNNKGIEQSDPPPAPTTEVKQPRSNPPSVAQAEGKPQNILQEPGTHFGYTIPLMIFLSIMAAFLLYSLAQLWPLPTPTQGTAPPFSTIRFIVLGEIQLLNEVRLILVVGLAGALGSLVHALRSLYWYVGNREFVRSWSLKYLLLPLVGTTLSLIFYFVIRGGFFSPQVTIDQTSPFGFVALATLVGLFSEEAVLKLKQIAETVLTKKPKGKDATPQESGSQTIGKTRNETEPQNSKSDLRPVGPETPQAEKMAESKAPKAELDPESITNANAQEMGADTRSNSQPQQI